MAEIRLEGIGHRYDGGPPALADVDITWDNGGAYALLGPSGCGKTTMLNIISGLVAPTEGRVLFDGVDVTQRSTVARNIAQVFQFPVLYERMTVEQNLRFPLRNRGVAPAEAQHRAAEIAELLGIAHLLKRRARGLTAEVKQLVSLGRALVRRDVSAILFDEPLTVADPHKKWELRQALKRVHTELSHTLVYVTHDQTEALTFADVVVVMDAGRILQRGTPDELFERPAHRFVGHFIGSPGMNFMPATVRAGAVSVAGVEVLALAADTARAAESGETARAAESGDTAGDGEPGPDDAVGVRPEFVHCVEAGTPGTLDATVVATRDLGTAHLVALAVGELPLIARVPAGDPVPTGPCGVAFAPGKVHLFRQGWRVAGADNGADTAAPTAETAEEGSR
jgi:glycerol transport system ATP-binding protein